MGIVVALVVLLIGGVYVLTNDDGKNKKKGATEQAAGEVFLEPISDVGPAPFTDNYDTNTAPAPPAPTPRSTSSSSSSSSSSSGPSTSVPATALRGITGTVPGLYGGSGNASSCDVPKLIDFLEHNPDKAKAWAEVLGIEPSGIRDYVMALTPVVLRADTRVTNHGYSNGRPTTLQSILQAGTAVLVDSVGVPRVKCNCGNPLLPPTPVSGPPTYTGTQWLGFNPTTVIVVQPAPTPAPTIILVNLNHGEPIERPPGVNDSGTPADTPVLIDTYCDLYPRECVPEAIAPPATTTTTRPGEEQLGTGELQATLRWYSTADLDLSITDPQGNTISYSSPSSPTGGTLDVDANSGCNTMTSVPAENVFWPSGSARVGEYKITVTYYESCAGGEGPQPFDVTVLSDGGEVAVVPATARAATATSAHTTTAMPITRTYSFRVQGRANLLLAHNTGTLNAPGDTQTLLAKKEGPPRLDAPPGAPTNVRATPGTNSATLTWQPPASSGGGTVQRYIITIQPGGTEIVAYAPATSIDIPGLRAGTPYTFTVTAENTNGKGPASGPSNSITPTAGTTGTTGTTTPVTTPDSQTGDPPIPQWKPLPDATHPIPPTKRGVPGAPPWSSIRDEWVWRGGFEAGGLDGVVYWDPPDNHGDSPITSWILVVERLQAHRWIDQEGFIIDDPDPELIDVAAGQFIHSFWGSKPDTWWRVRISAVNAQGEGPPSVWHSFSIGCDVYGTSIDPEIPGGYPNYTAPGVGPQTMVRTLCEHDPINGPQDLGDTNATDQQISDLGKLLPGS